MEAFLTQYQINFWERVLAPAFVATIEMVVITTIFGTIFGFLFAVILIMTGKSTNRATRVVYRIVNFIVNATRSFPFLILMVFLLPFTKFVMGTSIGVKAAVVPLIVAATAFIAKLIENAMKEVDPSLIEAMRSFGISDSQIVFRAVLSEAMPGIISGIILATISILGCTAMAGAMGAGGIGSIALIYGYQKFNDAVMLLCTIILVIFTELIEVLGRVVYKKMK